jgi:hypothetical protein
VTVGHDQGLAQKVFHDFAYHEFLLQGISTLQVVISETLKRSLAGLAPSSNVTTGGDHNLTRNWISQFRVS